MSTTAAGELVADREVLQFFRAAGHLLAFVSPVFATYCRKNVGSVTISLHRASPKRATSQQPLSMRQPRSIWAWLAYTFGLRPRLISHPALLSAPLAQMTIACCELTDGDAVDFAVGALCTHPGELLALRIQTSATQAGQAPTVWLTDGGDRIPGHVACYVGASGQGEHGIQARVIYGGLTAETSMPRVILYSPVTQCNLNCIHCISRHTRTGANRLPDHIKAQLRDWCAAGQVEMIDTDYSGDILWADARFGGEIDFLIGLGVPFHINTNGVCLTAKVSERLCGSKLFAINISLDAAEDETFKRVRIGAPSLRDVIENIAGLLRARAAAGANFTVSLSFTLMRSTLHEWLDFIRMGATLGVDSVIARHLEAYTADMEEETLWHDQAAYNAARVEAVALAETLGVKLAAPPPFGGVAHAGRRPCSIPWSSAVLLGNGDVAACCVPGLVMGNLHETSMADIWNGPRYQELRATVNSPTPPAPCAACPMFRKTDNPDSYLIYSALRRLNASRRVVRIKFISAV